MTKTMTTTVQGPFIEALWRCRVLAVLAVLAVLCLWPGVSAAQDEAGYVGLQIRGVNFTDLQKLGLPSMSGVVVHNVLPGGPGEQAGFKVDDVILEYVGARVMGYTHMISLAKISRPGDTVKAKVLRAGKQMELTMTVATKPKVTQVDQETRDIEGLGVTVGVTSPALNALLGILHNVPGLAVTGVAEGGAAAMANISQGDVITSVGQTPVKTIAELQAAYDQALKDDPSRVIVRMMRGKDRAIAVVTPKK